MKINEFKQPKKIDESLAGAMFGEVPMAALKGLVSGKGGKHQLAQDIFLRDFYQDAITSLDNGVKSGYVDPKKSYGTTSTTQSNTQFGNATPQNVGPASGASGTNVTPPNASNALNAPTLAQPGTNVTTKAGTPGTTGSITTGGPGAPATSTTAPKPGSATTTPTGTPAAAKPDFFDPVNPAQTPPAPASSNGKPKRFTIEPEEPAKFTGAPAAAAPIAQQSKPVAKGYNFKTTQAGAPAQSQQTVKVPPQNVKFNTPATNQQNQQYKWAPKGMKIGPNTKLSSLGATGNLAESTYHSLNNVFESVISEMNGEGAATTTITDHMLEWFGQYMQGANWESKKAAILPHIKKIQDTYNSDKGKAAIKNLAKLAYAITGQRGSGMPAGAKNAVQNTTGVQQSAANNLTPEQLAAAVAALPAQEQQKVILQVQRLNVK